jgi:hypothetical protein
VDGFVYGRLAGSRYFRDFQHDPEAKRPPNPYQGISLASVEWERGFAEGFTTAQAQARKTSLHRV